VNTNGAGDAYTSGLLLAAMLRHTGKIFDHAPQESTAVTTMDKKEDASSVTRPPRGTVGGKKMTPYTLYMRENYVTLKQQCKEDKKAIFTKCHEMWENESDEVKFMYQRMVQEEYEVVGTNAETSTSIFSDTSLDALDSNQLSASHSGESGGIQFKIEHTANASLNLESAVQFAGLVAAYHVDPDTRDLDHIDLGELLRNSIMSLSPVEGAQEI
jgi:HMG (high mobility group) box